MAEYINKEQFLSSMGLVGDETKYGNRDSEHQNRSYGTWIGYEIMDSIDDCVEEDAVRVVRCKECDFCIYDKVADETWCNNPAGLSSEVRDNDFCSYGERRQ